MTDLVEFDGTVVCLQFEGGFYGLLADDGREYEPINLPEPMRSHNLRVRVKGRLRTEMVSFRMWGEIIEIIDISAATGPDRQNAVN
ncbi:hypothetical protein [Trichloromonas sp.]|uniref:hypothetical protein n=1 Tax=Trichloromonas sp. TaxID=3069249 RepID=UPI003D81831B